jgi:TRAP transporter TAXI family solute receptor
MPWSNSSVKCFSMKRLGSEVPMKRKITVILAAFFIISVLANVSPSELQAEEDFVTIGSGDFSGVYFPTGLAIAKMLNDKRQDYGIRATVEATAGSTFNLNAITAGYMDFGLTQTDKLFQAFSGLAEWEEKGPQEELRSVFSIYHETVTLVAAVDAGVNTVADLKGKRVSLGNPGSSQHLNVINTLEAFGIDPEKDLLAQTVYASEAPALLQDALIDAYFFTVGHPSEIIRRGLSNERKSHIVPISGPGIDKLVAEKKYYTRYTIPIQRLYPGLGGPTGVDTFGVMATLCTSSRVPDEIVYDVTKEVFENLDLFRRQHPALVELSKESMLKGISAPLHPGALKYYKEAGLIR